MKGPEGLGILPIWAKRRQKMKRNIKKALVSTLLAAVSASVILPVSVYGKTADSNKEIEKLRKKFAAFDEGENNWVDEEIVGCEFEPDAALKKKFDSASLELYVPEDNEEYMAKCVKGDNSEVYSIMYQGYTDAFVALVDYTPTNFYVKTPDNKYVEVLIPPVSVHMEWPDFYEYDFDGDNEDELMIQPKILHGTGYYEDTVIMIDKNEDDIWYAYHLATSLYGDYYEENLATVYRNGKLNLEFMEEETDEAIKVDSEDYIFIANSLVKIYPVEDEILVCSSPYAVIDGDIDSGMGYFSDYNIWLTLEYDGEGEFEIVDEMLQKSAEVLYEKEIDKLKKGSYYGFIEGPVVEEPLLLVATQVCEEITADDPDMVYCGAAAEAEAYMMKNNKLVKIGDLICSSAYMPLRYNLDGIVVENRFGAEVFVLENGKFVNTFAIDRGNESETKFQKYDGRKWSGISEKQYEELRTELTNSFAIYFEKIN